MEHALRVAAYCRVPSTDKGGSASLLAAQQAYLRGTSPGTASCAGIFSPTRACRHHPPPAQIRRFAPAGPVGGGGSDSHQEVSLRPQHGGRPPGDPAAEGAGGGVIFLSDGLTPGTATGFPYTIMASVAQESHGSPERAPAGGGSGHVAGWPSATTHCTAIPLQGGALTIQPEQAEVVREVYASVWRRVKGPTPLPGAHRGRGGPRRLRKRTGAWSAAMILQAAPQRKYCGDLLQKSTAPWTI